MIFLFVFISEMPFYNRPESDYLFVWGNHLYSVEGNCVYRLLDLRFNSGNSSIDPVLVVEYPVYIGDTLFGGGYFFRVNECEGVLVFGFSETGEESATWITEDHTNGWPNSPCYYEVGGKNYENLILKSDEFSYEYKLYTKWGKWGIEYIDEDKTRYAFRKYKDIPREYRVYPLGEENAFTPTQTRNSREYFVKPTHFVVSDGNKIYYDTKEQNAKPAIFKRSLLIGNEVSDDFTVETVADPIKKGVYFLLLKSDQCTFVSWNSTEGLIRKNLPSSLLSNPKMLISPELEKIVIIGTNGKICVENTRG